MRSVLLILGAQTNEFARGDYNRGLFETAIRTLEGHFEAMTTVIEDGYDVAEEIAKFVSADVVIYQYPVFWFMMPPGMKRYIDAVYAYDTFFTSNDGPYGSGGLMQGKRVMLSTTWNAPADAFGNRGGFFDGASTGDVLLPMRKSHQYCGFEELPAFSCHDVIKSPDLDADRERFARHLESVLGTARREPARDEDITDPAAGIRVIGRSRGLTPTTARKP